MKLGKVAIAGIGLIGGSLGLALKQHNIAEEVAGWDIDKNTLKKAKELGAIDSHSNSLKNLCNNTSLLVVATPVKYIVPTILAVSEFVTHTLIVTDVGSTKYSILNKLNKYLNNDAIKYVGGHPIAGTENSGVESAFPNLFAGKYCILTPTIDTDSLAKEKVKGLWESIGTKVIYMNPKEHDRLMAAVSHLPHMVAYTLVNTVKTYMGEKPIICGGGFKDFTRIAKSNPDMWCDIALENSQNILDCINLYITKLKELESIISQKDTKTLMGFFENARKIKIEDQ